jgi:hypothetical protein
MANLKVKDADAADKYLAASGAGTDIDPHVVLHAVDATGQGDVPITLDSEIVAVDATGQGDVPITLGGEVVDVDATGQGDVPITLDGETVDVSDRAARDLGKVDVAGIDAIGTAAGQATKANSLPVTLASDEDPLPVTDNGGSLTVDGTVTAQLSPQTSGGLSIFRSIDLDESEEAVKASAGQLFGFFLYNLASSKIYVKFYNDTVANVVVGTTTWALTIPLDADQGAVVEFTNGIAFSTAITVAATTGVADNDTGAPGANEVIANVFYK